MEGLLMNVALCIVGCGRRAETRGFCHRCWREMGANSRRSIERDAQFNGGAFKTKSKVAARLQMAHASVRVFGGGRRS